MRLDQFVAHAAGLSRSQARDEIRRGRIAVGGQVVKTPAAAVDGVAAVEWNAQPLALPGARYLMLHKPAGLVCAARDPLHRTVLECLPAVDAARVRIVGRLDIDTTGLLLLSDDGEWNHRITAPRSHCAKTYLAHLQAAIDDAALAALRGGVQLRGEKPLAPPLRVHRVGSDRVRLTITEGRYHQVKRMFAVVGHRVVGLHREAIGGLYLDAGLVPGQWRELTLAERSLVFQSGLD